MSSAVWGRRSIGLTQSQSETDYYAEFDAFRRHHPKRETAITDAVIRNGVRCRGKLSLLDVGSNDGLLLERLVVRLRCNGIDYDITCVEPSRAPLARLKARVRQFENASIFNGTIEEFLDTCEHGRFDVVVCSHVFYHFAPPVPIVRALSNVLAPTGALLVVIDSCQSPCYKVIETMGLASSDVHRAYGEFVVAEVIESQLRQAKIGYQAFTLPALLSFASPGEVERTLRFLSRTTRGQTQTLNAAAGHLFDQFRASQTALVPWLEKLLVIRKKMETH